MLFDSHCHLQDERLAPILDQALARAAEAGVGRLLCCGVREEDWKEVLALARERPGMVVPSLGLHPWRIADRSPGWLDELERLLAGAPCGVGEIGLDHALEPRNDARQEEVFLAQTAAGAPAGTAGLRSLPQGTGPVLELLRNEGGAPMAALSTHSGA